MDGVTARRAGQVSTEASFRRIVHSRVRWAVASDGPSRQNSDIQTQVPTGEVNTRDETQVAQSVEVLKLERPARELRTQCTGKWIVQHSTAKHGRAATADTPCMCFEHDWLHGER